MLDIGWSEMAMIALLALMVIGPKDLPRVMRTVGQWVRKARHYARDFQSSLDEMIEDDELREAKRTIEQQTRNINKRDALGIGDALEKHVDPNSNLGGSWNTTGMMESGQDVFSSSSSDGSSVTSELQGEVGNAAAMQSDSTALNEEEDALANGTNFVETETPVAPAHSVRSSPQDAPSGSGSDTVTGSNGEVSNDEVHVHGGGGAKA